MPVLGSRHGSVVDARSLGRPRRWHVGRCTRRHDARRPGGRPARVPSLLGGRAPQHGHGGEHDARCARRTSRVGHRANSGRVGRGDAAQPRSDLDRRTVRAARGAVSGSDRPRHRARARHRPDDRLGVRPTSARERREVPPGSPGCHGSAGRPARRGWPLEPSASNPCCGLVADGRAARVVGIQRSARGDARTAVRVRASLRHRVHRHGVTAVPRPVRAVAGPRRAVPHRRGGCARGPRPTERRSESVYRAGFFDSASGPTAATRSSPPTMPSGTPTPNRRAGCRARR